MRYRLACLGSIWSAALLFDHTGAGLAAEEQKVVVSSGQTTLTLLCSDFEQSGAYKLYILLYDVRLTGSNAPSTFSISLLPDGNSGYRLALTLSMDNQYYSEAIGPEALARLQTASTLKLIFDDQNTRGLELGAIEFDLRHLQVAVSRDITLPGCVP